MNFRDSRSARIASRSGMADIAKHPTNHPTSPRGRDFEASGATFFFQVRSKVSFQKVTL